MKKVLYVDDEETNLMLFEINFKGMFNITSTTSPFEALEIIKNRDIDVVVTDYKMPGLNGMQLATKIKEQFPGVACILLSGYVEAKVLANKELVCDFIMKPYVVNRLKDVIETAFAQQNTG